MSGHCAKNVMEKRVARRKLRFNATTSGSKFELGFLFFRFNSSHSVNNTKHSKKSGVRGLLHCGDN